MSVAAIEKLSNVFEYVTCGPGFGITGAVFNSLTVIWKFFWSYKFGEPLSVARMVMT